MRLEEACNEVFARHETFHPRLGWFRKSYHAANRESGGRFFLDELAPTRLGVGKNMVRSIRFWGVASHLITEVPNVDRPRQKDTIATNFGVGLLGPNGLDPYMERPQTWWWLHWMLLSPGSSLPVWWLLLNELNVVEFNQELAEQFVVQQLNSAPFRSPNTSSVAKDVSAFIRTYVSGSAVRGKYDDRFGAPLRDLRLVEPSGVGFRFATQPDPSLGGNMVLAALLDFVALSGRPEQTLSLSRAATESGSPARAFRLSEDQLVELLRPVVAESEWAEISTPAGSLQLAWAGKASERANEVLYSEYQRKYEEGSPPIAGPEARAPHADASWSPEFCQEAKEVVL